MPEKEKAEELHRKLEVLLAEYRLLGYRVCATDLGSWIEMPSGDHIEINLFAEGE